MDLNLADYNLTDYILDNSLPQTGNNGDILSSTMNSKFEEEMRQMISKQDATITQILEELKTLNRNIETLCQQRQSSTPVIVKIPVEFDFDKTSLRRLTDSIVTVVKKDQQSKGNQSKEKQPKEKQTKKDEQPKKNQPGENQHSKETQPEKDRQSKEKQIDRRVFGIGKRIFLVIFCGLLAGQLFWIYVYQRRHRQHGEFRTNILKSITTTKIQSTRKEKPTVPDIPILMWWDSVYDSVDEVKNCGPRSCRISNNRSLKNHPDTKGFLFYGSHFKPYNLPFPRKQDHIWALIHEESPRNAYILSHGSGLDIFDFTSTYNRKSNYPITTQWLRCADWLQETKFVLPLVDKNRLRHAGLAPVLYIQSDCGVPSDRDSYVELLQQYIEVDSYGACKHNKDMPKRLYFRENMIPLEDKEFHQFVSRYKFTLAFENYICEDYITEKVWRPLRVGSIPIVFGAPNIRDYLPSNKSAILIEDFEDVADLASYIHLLDSNDRLYLEYLDFKREPIKNENLLKQLKERGWEPELCSREGINQESKAGPQSKKSQLKRKYESIFYAFECFLCNAITDTIESKGTTIRKAKQPSFLDHYKCPSPRKFDQNGHYSIHDKVWSAEWMYGKYEANVLEMLYRENRTCSMTEYRQQVEEAYTEDQ